jgi:hypothetical protein
VLHVLVLTQTALGRVAELCLRRLDPDDGQTSAEYALVLLGAAGVALLLGAWAGQTDKIGKLFDAVFDGVIRSVKAG